MNAPIVFMATTDGLLALAADSQSREKKVNLKKLQKKIDPIGLHLVKVHYDLNENEIRVQWFVKYRNQFIPAILLMDVSRLIFREHIIQVGIKNGKKKCSEKKQKKSK